MTKLAVMAVAEEQFRAGNRGLAIDVTRAMNECRVAWDVERAMRAMDAQAARAMFSRLLAEVGEGASFNRIAAWLTANVEAVASIPA